jgi:hypothetical protein
MLGTTDDSFTGFLFPLFAPRIDQHIPALSSGVIGRYVFRKNDLREPINKCRYGNTN